VCGCAAPKLPKQCAMRPAGVAVLHGTTKRGLARLRILAALVRRLRWAAPHATTHRPLDAPA
jgi:hypothetical protein